MISSLNAYTAIEQLLQVKCEVIEKNFTGYEREELSNEFRFKVLHAGWPEPQRKRGRGWQRAWRPSPPIKRIIVEIHTLTASYITRT